jgi:hypothetical protein
VIKDVREEIWYNNEKMEKMKRKLEKGRERIVSNYSVQLSRG